MEERKLRKRIPVKVRKESSVIHDPLEYIINRSSLQARKIETYQDQMQVNIWLDKHYCTRFQHGDEIGKRKGIDPDLVKSIVIECIPWLNSCSSICKFFRFANHINDQEHYHRIVLQKQTDEGLLNIVTEFHWIGIREYEVTVKTAMVADDFRLSDGQLALRVDNTGCIVFRMENNKPREVIQI